ncbi:MAG: hypothetical protein AB8G11_22210 [Saprospiraceae bacterium]
MKGREFGFSRLLLLIGSLLGIWAFFRPFYQIDALLIRPSAYDIIMQSIEYSETQKTFGFLNDLVIQELISNPTFYIPIAIMLVIPIIFGIVAIELLFRSIFLRFDVTHRVWIFLILSFIGIITGYWLGQQQNIFEFYFFESIRTGYWQSLTMVLLSLLAKYVD